MRTIGKIAASALCLCLLAATAGNAQNLVFTPIDFPGAILTNAQGINGQGEIVGFYTDTAGCTHGFVQSGGIFDRSTIRMPTGHRRSASDQAWVRPTADSRPASTSRSVPHRGFHSGHSTLLFP